MSYSKSFFDSWSSEMAYVLGFFYADGYLQKNSRGSSYVCFVSTDKELIQGIHAILKSNHKIGEKPPSKFRKKTLYVLQIGSTYWFEKLESLGLTQNKSLTIRLPQIPREYLSHFVRGYFDGDGGVYLEKYFAKDRNEYRWVFSCSFTSGSRLFLEDLHEALSFYISGGQLKTKERGFELVFSHRDSLALSHLMYDNAPTELLLKRKFEVFQQAFRVLNMRI
ncbi:MAG: LAGLIDADG family homing endonuclease [Patescibacteria group bacterium]